MKPEEQNDTGFDPWRFALRNRPKPSAWPEMDFGNPRPKVELSAREVLNQPVRVRWVALASVAAIVGALVVSYIVSTGSQGPGQPGAVALAVEGAVEIRATEHSSGDLLAQGEPVQMGAWVVTGSDGRVDLALRKGHLVRVKPDSRFRLQDDVGDSNFLASGRVLSIVDRLEADQSFAVETPTAIAGVRGTRFRVAVGEEGKTEVHVVRGEVEVSGSGSQPAFEPVVLYDHQVVEVDSQATAPEVRDNQDPSFQDERDLSSMMSIVVDNSLDDSQREVANLDAVQRQIEQRQAGYATIRLRDGTDVRGEIISQVNGQVYVEQADGSHVYQASEIREVIYQ